MKADEVQLAWRREDSLLVFVSMPITFKFNLVKELPTCIDHDRAIRFRELDLRKSRLRVAVVDAAV